MITVTINGKKVAIEKPVTILEAARRAGIKIPTLCHHEMLESFGGCRLCLVEVEKMPRLQTSCTQYVTDGMMVWTETERVVEARKAILEFLLINHALDCPYCDKAGECDLQDVVVKYGATTGRFAEGKRTHPESYEDPIIVRNMERCISCTRCVRMCDKVQGAYAISMVNRSSQTFVEPFSGKRYDCEYCGNCLTVCPVGAIMSRLHRYTYRAWLIEKNVDTVCPYCGVGCSVTAQVRANSIVRVVPEVAQGLNKGLLCSRGRFGYDYVSSPRRLKTPLIRKDGELQSASWSEALNYIAQRLKKIKEEHGGDAIAGIASPRCTNEDIYVFQKFLRVVLGTNNIDSAASFAYAPAQRFLERIFGQGVTANSLHGISNSDGIFVIGGDPTAVNPVLGLQIRSACQKGAPVIAVGYTPGLKRFTTYGLNPSPFTETALLAALVSELKEKRAHTAEKSAVERLIKGIPAVSIDEAEKVCGITTEEMDNVINASMNMTNPSIIIGRDIVQRANGHTNLLLLAALIHLLNGRIYLLSELPNEQGIIDMGCLPDMLPGERPVEIESFRRRYEEFTGGEVPHAPGRGFMEIIDGAYSGKIKAVYVMGENVVFNTPNNKYVSDSLSRLQLLVVHDVFLTETTGLAHVVLPSPSWAEKDGSYTNLERRMQLLRKAVDGEGLQDWKAIAEISKILGFDMKYRNSGDVLSEIARVSPLHKNITNDDMAAGDCMWPYKGEPLRHGVSIEGIDLPDKKDLLKKTENDKIYAAVDKPLFHSESLSRHSSALQSISPVPYVKISPLLSEKLSLFPGEYVSISTETGIVEMPAIVDHDLPENLILISNNFENSGIFKITEWRINSVLKTPELDGLDVRVRKIGG